MPLYLKKQKLALENAKESGAILYGSKSIHWTGALVQSPSAKVWQAGSTV
jgi:hypothetical protein